MIEARVIVTRLEQRSEDDPNTGCRLWFGASDARGYGRIRFAGRAHLAHRAAYQVHRGPIGDKLVLHRCDTPACINPTHLFLGSAQDNSDDMVAKGRGAGKQSRGVENPSAKLTEEAVRDIIALRYKAVQQNLADKYGVTRERISQIQRRQAWRHVAEDQPVVGR